MPAALLRSTACLRQQGQQHGRELQNQKQEDFCSTVLEAELLQLLRHCRVQLEQLQRNPGVGVATPVWSSSNNSSRREGDILVPSEYAVKSAAAWARLLQNLQTLILLQQRLQKQQERHQQQPEASAPEAAAAAIAAFVQEMQQFCNNKSCCNSIRGTLMAQLPKKRVYWEQQAKAQHEQLLLQLVDRMLADLELWAEEAPSDDDAAASPVPAQVAGTEQQQRRQRQVVAEERHDILLLEDRRNRELLLPRDSIPMRKEPAAFVASPAAPRAESAVSDNQLEEHLLDTASEMKQGALMFKERLQKDNILLQRTAATQETLQQQQQRGLDAARKLLRVSFFSSLMPLLQLAISLAVTVAMISFILATPG